MQCTCPCEHVTYNDGSVSGLSEFDIISLTGGEGGRPTYRDHGGKYLIFRGYEWVRTLYPDSTSRQSGDRASRTANERVAY